MASLEGKVIAITGAASGIGLATAKLLASRGAKLSLVDVQQEGLDAAASTIKEAGHPDVLTATVDVRNVAQVDDWIKQTVDKFGGLDGAANLAGVLGKNYGQAGIESENEENWEFLLGVNLTGVMHCLRAQLPRIREGGAVVNAASVLGLQGSAGRAAYVASKHGVIGLTRTAAKEVGKRGVRVNCIAPYVHSRFCFLGGPYWLLTHLPV